MLKATLVSLIALSLVLAPLACEPAEESTDEQEAVEDTTAIPSDSIVATIGGDWIVRAKSGKACVSVPPSAIPEGQTLDVQIKLVPPFPPGFDRASQVFPPVYDFVVRDQNGDTAQFIDSVDFAICVNYGNTPRPSQVALARAVSADSLEYLPVVPVPDACRLTCNEYSASETAAWLDDWFGGSPLTATPAHAAVAQEGLGGKGGGTSPFAGVVP
ncbi:MAG TPA: hypothetical protein VMR66_11760 [Gemmatimonadota bacterium]|nr:hypothetical protein [Gemmatimonadota bacterium]